MITELRISSTGVAPRRPDPRAPNSCGESRNASSNQLNAAVSLASLRIPPGNHLEALGHDRQGQHSMRINDQYRICFVWTDEGPEWVEITDYH